VIVRETWSVFSSSGIALVTGLQSASLTNSTRTFLKTTSHHHERLHTGAKQFCTSELETLAAQSERIDQQLQRVQDALGVIQAQDKLSQEAIIVVKDVVKDTSEKVKNELKTWSEDLMKNCDTLSKEVEANGTSGFVVVRVCHVLFVHDLTVYRWRKE